MTKTRIFALVLCALMLLAMFAGCAKTETTTPDTGTTTPSTGTTTPSTGTTTPSTGTTTPSTGSTTPDAGTTFQYTGSYPVVEEKTTIEWYTTNTGSLDYDWSTKEWLHALCEMANIELEMTLIDSSVYSDTTTPMLAAGIDLPEVWRMPATDWDGTYSGSGLIKEITSYVNENGYNLNRMFELNPTWKGSITDPNGQIWYFPSIGVGTYKQMTMLYVRSYLDVLGWEAPEHIDDLYAYLCDIRDNDCNGDGHPTDEIPMFNRPGERIYKMAGLWGCEMESRWTPTEDGQDIQFSYTMDGYKEFLTYYNRLYTEDLLNKSFDTAGSDEFLNVHAYNRMGVLTQYASTAVNWTREWNPDWDMDNEELLCFPAAPLKGGCDNPFWTGRSEISPTFAINSALDDAKALAAFCFMDFMIGPEAGEIRTHGTDKTKYHIDAETGFVIQDDPVFYNEQAKVLGSNFKGIPDNEKWTQYNNLMLYQGKAFTEHLAREASEGFTHVPTIVECYKLPEEQDVISRYETDLRTYCDENFSGFISGNTPLTEWDNYVAACESLGVNELKEVYSAVYKRLIGA